MAQRTIWHRMAQNNMAQNYMAQNNMAQNGTERWMVDCDAYGVNQIETGGVLLAINRGMDSHCILTEFKTAEGRAPQYYETGFEV